MGSLSTALLVASVADPAVVLAIWSVACVGALGVGSGVAFKLQPAPSVLAAKLRHQPRHAEGHVDQVAADDTVQHGPRHARHGEQVWRPAHTVASLRHRGRHHTGERRLVASLLDTQAITPAADLLAAVAKFKAGTR